jgi:hypothetical protein
MTAAVPAGPESSPSWSTVCQNCGAALSGPFCAQCGQRAVPPHPTVRELAGNAWDELVGWDGKFLRTLRVLVQRPGELTRAAVEGRRARCVGAVRLYLICSVLYFVIAAIAPLPDFEATVGSGVDVSFPEPTPEGAALGKALREGLASLTPEERAIVEAEIDAQPAVMRPLYRTQLEDFAGFQRRVNEIMPRALFLLVPALAALLALFYRGRHFPQHLYAALHLQAFVCLVASVVTIVRFTQSITALATAIVAAAVVILGHTMLAQRRIYEEPWPSTALKAIAVAALYALLWGLASTGAAIVAART